MEERILSKIYYTPGSAGFMGAVDAVYRVAKKHGIKKSSVILWINSQRSYTLHKQTPNRFPRNKTTAVGLHTHIQSDTIHLQSLKYHNSHYSYILTMICVMSRQARAEPLKRKLTSEVLPVLKRMIASYEGPIWYLSTDKGYVL